MRRVISFVLVGRCWCQHEDPTFGGRDGVVSGLAASCGADLRDEANSCQADFNHPQHCHGRIGR